MASTMMRQLLMLSKARASIVPSGLLMVASVARAWVARFALSCLDPLPLSWCDFCVASSNPIFHVRALGSSQSVHEPAFGRFIPVVLQQFFLWHLQLLCKK